MDARAIGIFDSGLGGLTAVKQLHRLAPGEDIVFLGDTARVPYGTRPAETIIRYSLEDISFLLSFDIKLIVAACGTVSSTLPRAYAESLPVPFVDVIAPTARAAAAATRNGRIGILGTPATIRSGSFVRALAAIDPALVPLPQACPLFVPLVENGYFARDCAVTRLVAQEYLQPLKDAGADTIILGCTHYPIIQDIIADTVGSGVRLIDSGLETARHALALLDGRDARGGSGSIRFYTSDETDGFESNAGVFLGHPLAQRACKADLQRVALHPCFGIREDEE